MQDRRDGLLVMARPYSGISGAIPVSAPNLQEKRIVVGGFTFLDGAECRAVRGVAAWRCGNRPSVIQYRTFLVWLLVGAARTARRDYRSAVGFLAVRVPNP